MRRTSLALAFALMASAACGEGRAIFNIDVFSFLESSNVDTIPYAGPLPPGVPDTIPVQSIQLLPIGLGNSAVDSVRVTATLDFVNSGGTGSLSARRSAAAARCGSTHSPSADSACSLHRA